MNRKLLFFGIAILLAMVTGDLIIKQSSRSTTSGLNFSASELSKVISKKKTKQVWESDKKNNEVDTAALKQTDWYANVIKNIEASEYNFNMEKQSGNYSAPNRVQQLIGKFNSKGFTLEPQDEKNNWKLSLQLSGIYADHQLYAKPGDADPATIESNKVIFGNTQFNTEYLNSKAGLRQNFIIKSKPANNPKTLQLHIQTKGNWYVNKAHDHELHFAKMNGNQLTSKIIYNSLKVWDANNKELLAKFVVNKKHTAFEIEVNAADAVYPVTIDPISTTPATYLFGVNPADQFGWSVSNAGDVNNDGFSDVVVGAPNVSSNTGAAYIFYGSSTGLSASPATTLNGVTTNNFFGYSVANAGDINADGYSDVIIGAFGVSTNTGAAYIFLGSNTGLSTPPTILNGVSTHNSFGSSVACAGDVNGDGFSDVIVGAQEVTTYTGAAYIFLGTGTGISTSPITTFNGSSTNNLFGETVASAGDVNGDGFSDVIVGAGGVSTNTGAAYIFLGNNGTISTIAATTVTGSSSGDWFGSSVACAGDVNGDGYSDVVVGAFGVSSQTGSAYIFLGSPGGLSAIRATTLNGISTNNLFGVSVACAGDVNGDGYSDVIIGAQYVSTHTGAAYLFLGAGAGLSASPATTLNGISTNNLFGFTVASAGDVNGDGYSDLVIGAYGASSSTGAAYTYHGSPDGLKTTNNWATESNNYEANYGLSVASAGDINSDGYSDVLVGAYIYSVSYREGRAYLYLGAASGLSTTAAWTGTGTMNSEYFGSCVSGAGDVNGDGYDDVLVGAYGYSNGEYQEGRAYLYYGTSGGLTVSAAWTYESNVAGAVLGRAVATAGDVNGDGYGDIIIGSPWWGTTPTITDEGKVYVFYGSSTIPAAVPNWTAQSIQNNSFYAYFVASLGDVNGDGYSDIIVGAPFYDNGFTDDGKVFVYYGSATGLPGAASWTKTGTQMSGYFGMSVASAGDVNGDGYSDAIIGANGMGSNAGAAYLYLGGSGGLAASPGTTLTGISPNDAFGYCVSSAGDVNGDGYSDVVVGAYAVASIRGAGYIFLGSNIGLSATASSVFNGLNTGDRFGQAIAGAGDVNGDGYSDVIGGSCYYANPDWREGAAYVFYGNNNTSIRNNLRLYNTDLTTPVSHLNFNDPNLFGAGLFVRSPLGRVKAKLVWEVKKQGFAFSGNPITNSTSYFDKQTSFTDLGIAGIELKNNVQKQGMQTKIRARVQYDLATAITGQVYGPWRYPTAYLQGAHGMNSIPLPVKLTEFTAALMSEKVETQWTVADDENVTTYQVERSADNQNFTSIGIVSSLHQNNSIYHFTDQHPLKGRSWYRLHIMDNNNRIGYSKTALIKNIQDGLQVYPTVLNKGESINLQLGKQQSGNMDIQLLNSAGVIVFRKAIKVNSGGIYSLTLPALPAGVYVLSVVQLGEKILTQKIVIQ